MTQRTSSIRVLGALWQAARRGAALDLAALSGKSGCSPLELRRCLRELEAVGFVDSAKLRLTLSGLAVAVASERSGRARRLESAA